MINRQYFLDLAASGLKMPIGTDLVLREKPDHDAIVLDGRRLGAIIAETARRFRTPLAIPLMDLTLEKEVLLGMLGVSAPEIPTYHFSQPPSDEMMQTVARRLEEPLPARLQAHVDAVRYIAEQEKDLLAIGMTIGPFSLMTKLITDPIVPVYMAGTGLTGAENADVRMVERCLELAGGIVRRSVSEQIRAGAKAVFIAEPAANLIYISPRQMGKPNDVFQRFVTSEHRRIRKLLTDSGVELIFHCCGELTDQMVRAFADLDPAILSLGSSRLLWEDAAIVPKRTVLFGNLPSKKFFSDREITVEEVRRRGDELIRRMREVGHPFILGSECDVLSVPGCEETIRRKAMALLECQ